MTKSFSKSLRNVQMKLLVLTHYQYVFKNVMLLVRYFLWALFEKPFTKLLVQHKLKKFVSNLHKTLKSFIFQRRPLLIYIHNDENLLSKTFCKNIFCSTRVIEYLLDHYIVWPWDITYQSNRNT
jgi:thioredoxin-related protein